jgi:hypothetical protein
MPTLACVNRRCWAQLVQCRWSPALATFSRPRTVLYCILGRQLLAPDNSRKKDAVAHSRVAAAGSICRV